MDRTAQDLSRRDLLRQLKDASREVYSRPAFFVPDRERAPRREMPLEETSRRDFVQGMTVTLASATVVASCGPGVVSATASRHEIIAAVGDTLIPSDPGDPGYRDLEEHKITDEVLKALPGVSDADTTLWNESAKATSDGKTFVELDGSQRAEYLRRVIDGTAVSNVSDSDVLQRVYRNARRRIVALYYSNYPEHQWPRDRQGMPILKPGDKRQMTNPNTTTLTTGWDQSGFHGPLTWEEEERRRNLMKTIPGRRGRDGLDWHEGWSPFDYQPEAPKTERPGDA